MERKALILSAALALPLIGLGLAWADTHRKAQMGTDWIVPIRGYDPRDLLRGHYITYRYDWPGLKNDDMGFITQLCLEGSAPTITRVTIPGAAVVGEGGVPQPEPKCAITIRAPTGGDDRRNGLEGGLFYVPQDKAADYEKKLRDPLLQGFIRLRIRDDGITRPVALTFQPRPIPADGQDDATPPR